MTQRTIDQAIEELHLKLVEVLDKPEAFQEAIRTTLETERRQADKRLREVVGEIHKQVIDTIDFWEKRNGSTVTPVFTDVNTDIKAIAAKHNIDITPNTPQV